MKFFFILIIFGFFLLYSSIYIVQDFNIIYTTTFSPILNMVNPNFFSPPPPAPPFPPPIYYRRHDSGIRPMSIAGTGGGVIEFYTHRRRRGNFRRKLKKPRKITNNSKI